MSDYRAFDLDQWLDHIQRQHWRTIDLQLDRINSVWRRLGAWRPPLVITVAGTNGKGSSVAMLEAVLRQAGRRTGSYTSPHLVRYNERVCIDGQPAGDDELITAFRRVEEVRGDIPLTYFEFGTVCALLVFEARQVEAAILETGMGGRLDAVNIVDNDLALITNVGLDHQQWLGNDRETIAVEKAGVIKPGARVVSAEPDPPAAIARVARERGAQLLQAESDYSVSAESGDRRCRWSSDHPAVPDDWRQLDDLHLPFEGQWQVHNLGGVIASLALTSDLSGVTPAHLASGLSQAHLAGRCQVVNAAPLTIIDVAHNADSARGLARFLDNHPVKGKTHGVFGLLRDKALDSVLGDLLDKVDCWHLATVEGERGQESTQLLARMQCLDPRIRAIPYDNAVAAFRGARQAAAPDDRIVAFGSFFVVGDIIGALEDEGSA